MLDGGQNTLTAERETASRDAVLDLQKITLLQLFIYSFKLTSAFHYFLFTALATLRSVSCRALVS